MIYTFTAVTFFLMSIYLWREESQEKTRLLFVIAMVWLVLHDGLRWDVGTDWIHYYNLFIDNDNVHMGFTYSLINKIFRFFTDQYNVFLVFYAVVLYSVVGRIIYKYSPNPLMSICIYYCGMLGIMGANRQLWAMAVCLMSLYFVFEQKKWYFIGMVLFATTIHITALSFLPAYFLLNLSYQKKTVLLIVCGAFMIGLLKLVNLIPFVDYLALLDNLTSNTSTAEYVDANTDLSVSIVGSFKRVLFVYLALYVKDIVHSKEFDYFLLLYVIGCCIYLVFNGTVLQVVAGRGAMYYSVFECIVIAYMITYFPAEFFEKEVLWLFFFVFFFYLMWRDMNNYVILTGEDCFNPYKCVLFYTPI